MINGYIDKQTTTGQYMDGTPEPTEALTQNEIVLEVESELRGLRRAHVIMSCPTGDRNSALEMLCDEVEQLEHVLFEILHEITEDDDDE